MRKIRTLLLTMCLVGVICACGSEEENAAAEVTNVVEESVGTEVADIEMGNIADDVTEESIATKEQAQAMVEDVVEDSMENLTNEEWVQSLNVQVPTFLVFNENTGERKVLENGQEYVLMEGDEIGFIGPKGAKLLALEEYVILYTDSEIKNGCLVYYIDWNLIGKKTEFTRKCKTEEGEILSVTVYLSK